MNAFSRTSYSTSGSGAVSGYGVVSGPMSMPMSMPALFTAPLPSSSPTSHFAQAQSHSHQQTPLHNLSHASTSFTPPSGPPPPLGPSPSPFSPPHLPHMPQHPNASGFPPVIHTLARGQGHTDNSPSHNPPSRHTVLTQTIDLIRSLLPSPSRLTVTKQKDLYSAHHLSPRWMLRIKSWQRAGGGQVMNRLFPVRAGEE